jgi:hypothetical protein
MSYRTAKISFLLFLAVYFSTGMWSHFSAQGEENSYPFFSWFLYAPVPLRIQSEYGIRFLEIGGRTVDPPLFFEKTVGAYNPRRLSPGGYYQLIQLLGGAVKSKDAQEIARLRTEIEMEITDHPAVYEISEIIFNPVERWRNGTVMEISPLAQFTAK